MCANLHDNVSDLILDWTWSYLSYPNLTGCLRRCEIGDNTSAKFRMAGPRIQPCVKVRYGNYAQEKADTGERLLKEGNFFFSGRGENS